MELEIQALKERLQQEGNDPQTALQKAIAESIEKAVHLRGGMAPGTLAEEIGRALTIELAGADESVLQFAFEHLIRTVQRPKEKEIERLLVELDRLKRHLHTEEEELRRNLREIFGGLEHAAQQLENPARSRWIEALENTELEHVEGLGILSETAEAALVAALEEGEKIDDAIRETVRHITLKALGEGVLSAPRIRAILTTVLEKSAELAEATPTQAETIVHATVYGINDALILTVKQIKEQLAFAPEELKESRVASWSELTRMLSRSDELYKEIIDAVAAKNSPFIAKILQKAADILGDQFAELKRISHETIEVAKERLSALAKEAALRGAELKNQLGREARKLGLKAWQKALEMAEAYKSRIEK